MMPSSVVKQPTSTRCLAILGGLLAVCPSLSLSAPSIGISPQDASSPRRVLPGEPLRELRPHSAVWQLVEETETGPVARGTMRTELALTASGEFRYEVSLDLNGRAMSYRHRLGRPDLVPIAMEADDPYGVFDVEYDAQTVRGTVLRSGEDLATPIAISSVDGFFDAGADSLLIAALGLNVGDAVTFPSVDLHEQAAGWIVARATGSDAEFQSEGFVGRATIVEVDQLGGTSSRRWILEEPPYVGRIELGSTGSRWRLLEVRS